MFSVVASVLTFAATDNTSGACGSMEYELLYAPASATPDLISLTSIGSRNVEFKASSNAGDALTYTLTISARFAGHTSWVRSASATFKYINPCPTSAITGVSFPSITTSVFVPTSSSTPLWYDSVSGSAASQLCGPFTIGVTFTTAPPSFD